MFVGHRQSARTEGSAALLCMEKASKSSDFATVAINGRES